MAEEELQHWAAISEGQAMVWTFTFNTRKGLGKYNLEEQP